MSEQERFIPQNRQFNTWRLGTQRLTEKSVSCIGFLDPSISACNSSFFCFLCNCTPALKKDFQTMHWLLLYKSNHALKNIPRCNYVYSVAHCRYCLISRQYYSIKCPLRSSFHNSCFLAMFLILREAITLLEKGQQHVLLRHNMKGSSQPYNAAYSECTVIREEEDRSICT